MSQEDLNKLAEARRIGDNDGGFAAAVNYLYGTPPKIRRTK
jgi:hypothetical protein